MGSKVSFVAMFSSERSVRSTSEECMDGEGRGEEWRVEAGFLLLQLLTYPELSLVTDV